MKRELSNGPEEHNPEVADSVNPGEQTIYFHEVQTEAMESRGQPGKAEP